MKTTIAGIVALTAPIAAVASPDDYATSRAEVVDHIACFPHGIDMISAGDVEGGMEIWRTCWSDDLVSNLNFTAASIVCPGEQCMFLANQPDLRGAEMRGALAQMGFQMAKFTATHHQLDTLSVSFSDADNATVSGMITATHFSDHQGPEVHFIHWTGSVAKTDAGWRITEETLDTVGHSVLPRAAE